MNEILDRFWCHGNLVFEKMLGSPYIPAQDSFVVPRSIKSVLGFGGTYPDGSLFSVIMFTKLVVERETAENFKAMGPAAKLATLPSYDGALFE